MAYTAIDDPSAYFKVQLYAGDGSANHAITFDDTDTDMQPDLVWIKNRSATDSHCVFDAVRGATEVLHADTTAIEATDADTLDSFTSDGFQVDADVKVNTNAENYVAWCWKAGAGAGSSNTDGSINTTSTSVSQTAGVSISKYTGTAANATVGHGLGVVPKMMIIKNLIDVDPWIVYHAGVDATAPEDYNLRLNTTEARINEAPKWNDTAPTSSVFSLGSSGANNGSGDATIAYCFAEKQGFSKFGSYEGNGNASGTYIHLGFSAAWIMFKHTSDTQSWYIYDVERRTYNPMNTFIKADTNQAEGTSGVNIFDITSNGIKIRNTGSVINTDGVTYIYMAFAEAPFVNSEGGPCNAT